ncbi:MAG: TRAP transporter small permease subunit [Flavobacteriaceae bacterium]
MALLRFLQTWIDRLNAAIGRIAAYGLVAAIVVSAANAIARKFGYSSNSWLELQWYLFGGAFMLCAAWTLQLNEHIRVDAVSAHYSRRVAAWVDIVGFVFFFAPFVATMLWFATPYFLIALRSGEHSSQAGGLLIWPARGFIVAGFVLLALQGLSELGKRIMVLIQRDDDDAAGEAVPMRGPR